MPKESIEAKKKRLADIIRRLKRYYPEPECALVHKNPFELLVATILSAQCTDARVNMVTPKLFARFPGPGDFAEADLAEVEELIRSTGFYKNKARNIIACSKDIVSEHGGQVPQSLDELTALAGVGRKTANVVLGNAFKIASGVVVDTHVTRLSNRLGLLKGKNAVIIERQLNEIVPRKYWIDFSHWLILHGRAICKARKPQCEKCFLEDICPQREYK